MNNQYTCTELAMFFVREIVCAIGSLFLIAAALYGFWIFFAGAGDLLIPLVTACILAVVAMFKLAR